MILLHANCTSVGKTIAEDNDEYHSKRGREEACGLEDECHHNATFPKEAQRMSSGKKAGERLTRAVRSVL